MSFSVHLRLRVYVLLAVIINMNGSFLTSSHLKVEKI